MARAQSTSSVMVALKAAEAWLIASQGGTTQVPLLQEHTLSIFLDLLL